MTHSKITFDDRTLLKVSGADSKSFLQGLITQDIDKMGIATALYSCLLTPQGKLLADFFLIPEGENILLDCAQEFGEMLIKKLTFYKLRAKVTIEDVSSIWVSGAIWAADVSGNEKSGRTGNLGQIMGLGGGDSGAIGYIDPRLGTLGLRFIAPAKDAGAALDHFEGTTGSSADYRAHCSGLGVPASGYDIISEQSFPMDLNLDALNGIDYQKGCFVGQEVSSRMKRKGEVRKRLWSATFKGSSPAPGTAIKAGETTIGEISSIVGDQALVKVRLDRLAKAESSFFASETEIILSEPVYLLT